jgi:uncharacterized OB-fold protein
MNRCQKCEWVRFPNVLWCRHCGYVPTSEEQGIIEQCIRVELSATVPTYFQHLEEAIKRSGLL